MEIEEENSQNSISSCQSTSSTQDSTKKIYNHLFSLNSDEEYWAFLRNRMPRTHGLNSHSRTYCKVDKTVAKHPTKIEKRKCKGHTIADPNNPLSSQEVDCPVEYMCYRCERCKVFEIRQHETHVNGCADFTPLVKVLETRMENDKEVEVEVERVQIHENAGTYGICPDVVAILDNFLDVQIEDQPAMVIHSWLLEKGQAEIMSGKNFK